MNSTNHFGNLFKKSIDNHFSKSYNAPMKSEDAMGKTTASFLHFKVMSFSSMENSHFKDKEEMSNYEEQCTRDFRQYGFQ